MTGLSPGGTSVTEPSGVGTAGVAAETTGRLRTTGQDAPVICSQLVFRPLVTGCQALLGPIGGSGLAPTGTPLLTGLVGVLLILVGGMTNWRSRVGKGTSNASRERRTTRTGA